MSDPVCETCTHNEGNDHIESVNYTYCGLHEKVVRWLDTCDDYGSVYGN